MNTESSVPVPATSLCVFIQNIIEYSGFAESISGRKPASINTVLVPLTLLIEPNNCTESLLVNICDSLCIYSCGITRFENFRNDIDPSKPLYFPKAPIFSEYLF